VYEALTYQCTRPLATGVWGLKLLVYGALRTCSSALLMRSAATAKSSLTAAKLLASCSASAPFIRSSAARSAARDRSTQ
jgi:hypothetical protein